MDSPTLALGALVLVPFLFLMLLRINATLVFLSLCLGSVLMQFVAPEAGQFLSIFSAHGADVSRLTTNNIKLGLLLLPVVLTAVFMIRTVRGGKLALNVIPAAGVGLLGALLAVPLLPPGLAHTIMSNPLWSQLTKMQVMIVGVTTLLCLLVLWLQRPQAGSQKHGKRGKHSD